MADTLEERILDGLKTALEAISKTASPAYRNSVRTVSLNAHDPDALRHEAGFRPALSVWHLSTDYRVQTGLWEEATMRVLILCYGDAYGNEERKQFAEDITDDVKHALYTDVTIGGLAEEVRVVRKEDNKSHPDAEAQGGQVAEVALTVEILYEQSLTWS